MSDESVFNINASSLRLGAVLAKGSSGITLYRAELQMGTRPMEVAVKRLHIDSAAAATKAEAAFLTEIQTLRRASGICHRACRLLGCCKIDGDACIVMTLYPASAAQLLQQAQEPLPLQDVIGMAVEMLEGLAQLHGAYILHLDLKPGNVLLDQYHHAYLSDFGISHALTTLEACTSTTGLSGTPHYMAPEQTDSDFGARGTHSDVWGFAACVLHLATGQLPYANLSQFQIMTSMVKRRSPEVPATVPSWMRQALQQCFSFDLAARPSVADLYQLFHAQAKQASPNPNEQQSVTSCSAFVGKVPVTHSAQEQLLLNVQPGSDDAKASKPVGQLNSSPDPEGEHILHLLQEHMGATAATWPAVAALLQSDSFSVQAAAVLELTKQAASSQQNKDAIIKANLLTTLARLLKSGNVHVVAAAAYALGNIAAGSQQNKDAIFAADALPGLVVLLKSDETDVQMAAAKALDNLALGSQQNKDAIFAAEALPALVGLLKSDETDVQMAAAKALDTLALGSQQNKDAILAKKLELQKKAYKELRWESAGPDRQYLLTRVWPLVLDGMKKTQGTTEWLEAADCGWIHLVELLISIGAEVDLKDSMGKTALMMASRSGHTPVAELLLAKGADVNAKDCNDRTALMNAAKQGCAPLVELLLAKGAEVDFRACDGMTALIEAAGYGHELVVTLLLEKGADVRIGDKNVSCLADNLLAAHLNDSTV